MTTQVPRSSICFVYILKRRSHKISKYVLNTSHHAFQICFLVCFPFQNQNIKDDLIGIHVQIIPKGSPKVGLKLSIKRSLNLIGWVLV